MGPDELHMGLIQPDDPEYEADLDGDADERRTIVVIVFAPKEIEPKRFRFRRDETVGVAAKTAATAFGYEEGNPSFQTKDGKVLERSLTLEAAGVHNREELELVDAGGGV
jgi:hypothetical protein